jgi:hypothetical protein
VQFGGFIPFVVLFDGGQPEPWRFATALVSEIIVIILGDRQNIVTGNAPHMKPLPGFATFEMP